MEVEELKRQQKLIQRTRGEIAKAVREVVANFKALGIEAYVKIPDIKEKLAYIVIPNTEIVDFMIRKIATHLRKVDRNISIKGGILDEFVAVKAICTNNVKLDDVNGSVNRFIEELKKNEINSTVNIYSEDYVTVNVLVNYMDISRFLGREVKKAVEKSNTKVGIACHVENDMFVVRITAR
jgi:hypothetical protein